MLLVCLKKKEEGRPREGKERTRRMTTRSGAGGWRYYLTHVAYSGVVAVDFGADPSDGEVRGGAEEGAHGHCDHGRDHHDHVMSSRDLDW